MTHILIDAIPDDEPWLDALRRRAYAALFDATWGGWDEARHRRHFSECLAQGHISIIEMGGTRVGMVQMLDHGESLEVAEVQVDPTHQRRGIGTRVLHDVIAKASARGLPVRLTVGIKNQKAISLYERLGFEIVERTATHCEMRRAV